MKVALVVLAVGLVAAGATIACIEFSDWAMLQEGADHDR